MAEAHGHTRRHRRGDAAFPAKRCDIGEMELDERAADICDVGRRVFTALIADDGADARGIPEGSILVADELSPSATARFELEGVKVKKGTPYWVVVSTNKKSATTFGAWAFNSTDMRETVNLTAGYVDGTWTSGTGLQAGFAVLGN